MGLSDEQRIDLQRQLQEAVEKCSERGLYHAARW